MECGALLFAPYPGGDAVRSKIKEAE